MSFDTWIWVKKKILWDHRFGQFFLLPIGFFRHPVLTHTHMTWGKSSTVPCCVDLFVTHLLTQEVRRTTEIPLRWILWSETHHESPASAAEFPSEISTSWRSAKHRFGCLRCVQQGHKQSVPSKPVPANGGMLGISALQSDTGLCELSDCKSACGQPASYCCRKSSLCWQRFWHAYGHIPECLMQADFHSISASGRVWSGVQPDRTFSSSMAMFTSGSSSEPGLSIHDSQIFQKGRAWTTASCEVLDGICKELERWNEWLHPSRAAENFWFLLVGRMPVHLSILVIFSGTLIFSLLVGSDPGKGAVWSLLELNQVPRIWLREQSSHSREIGFLFQDN